MNDENSPTTHKTNFSKWREAAAGDNGVQIFERHIMVNGLRSTPGLARAICDLAVTHNCTSFTQLILTDWAIQVRMSVVEGDWDEGRTKFATALEEM